VEELFRYQQVRQSQRLSGEDKLSTGLSLYPDNSMSPLAKDLIEINSGSVGDATVDNRLAEHIRATKQLEDASDLPPVTRALYDWLQFKSRPITPTHLADFLATLTKLDIGDFAQEWTS
jgi:hypothetical protein